MDSDRARELLARERQRLESAIATIENQGPLESDERKDSPDIDSEDLYQDEFDAGRLEDLRSDMAALDRAEARLADGTYGLSIESGEPIPDARLEAVPTAERTIEEQERFERS